MIPILWLCVQVVSITSFNEWGEGTQIEPARMNTAMELPGDQSEGEYLDYGKELGERGYLVKTAEWVNIFNAEHKEKKQQDVIAMDENNMEL